MNIKEGLERISAVWWGFCGFAIAGIGVVIAFDGQVLVGLCFMIGALFAAGFHRLTCWIIAGFFTKKP